MPKLAKNDPVRTAKEEMFVALMLDGRTAYQAAKEAGFTENQARHAYRIVERTQTTLQDAIRKTIPKDLIAKRLQEGLGAESTRFFAYKGEVLDERNVIDYTERREYAKLISQITGDLAPENTGPQFNFEVPPLITVNIGTPREPGQTALPSVDIPQDVVVQALPAHDNDVETPQVADNKG